MQKPVAVLVALASVVFFGLVFALHLGPGPGRDVRARASAGDTDDPEARLRYEWMMLHDPATGNIPADIRRKELEFAKSLPTRENMHALGKVAGAQSANWVSRGPWNVGGRTRALAVDVANVNVLVAGGVSGGMWRSANGGASWTKTSAPGSLHSVSCLAQDARPGQTATWYYGTGENIGNSASGNFSAPYTGDGMFKSVDNGVTWTQLASTAGGDPQAFDRAWDYVWNVAVHPVTGHVYAAAYNAIYRSTNGGAGWTLVRGGAETGPYSEMTDVAIAPDGTIYATGSPGSSTLEGIWTSTDGVTWFNITPADMSVVRRIVIGTAPSNPNTVYFLAETPGRGVNNHSLWKYDAGTVTYQNRSANMPSFGAPVGDFDSQGSYDLVIRVKPDNEQVVLLGGTNLYRSTDGFATSGNTAWIGGYATANDISQYPNHHPDQHALAFLPGNPLTLLSGHDGGISKTTNILGTPVVWQRLTNGYLTTQFYTVAIDHATNGSATIIGGTQDNGCWGTTSASGTVPWIDVNPPGGDGAYTAIANGGAFYCASSQNGWTNRVIPGPSPQQYARIDPQGGGGYLFVNPFVLDPNNSTVMYFAGGNYVWRNSNITQIPLGNRTPTSINWTRLNNSSIPGQTQVSALAVSKAAPSNRLYMGFSPQGYLLRVDDANTGDPAAVDIGAAIPSGFISSIAVDPTDGDKVFVVYSNYNVASLWYSADAGATWTDVEGNLAGADGPSCRSVVIVPVGGTTYYVLGTSTGVYSTTSLDGAGTVWVQEGAQSIGNVVVTFLDARPSDRTVVAGTHANGVYSADIVTGVSDEGDVPSTIVLAQNYPNPFNPSTVLGYSLAAETRVTLSIFNALGQEVARPVDGIREAGQHSVVWDASDAFGRRAGSGVYFYELRAGETRLVRKMVLLR